MSDFADRAILSPFERRHLPETLEWANDPEFARLMDRPRPIEPAEHERWFAALADRDDTMFFAIELDPGQQHVGNVWLAQIDRRHGKAELRVIIGERNRLGHGVGSQALDLAARYAFDALHLHRVYAYVLAINPRARRAFEKAGFVVEGVLRDDRRAGDEYTDVFVLGRIAS